ncbi:MAG TPA: hypothetical protein PKH68_01395 [Paludibacteraceae bacterium]|nr:hypothetical protein [Paludibacteraceae bacterium]
MKTLEKIVQFFYGLKTLTLEFMNKLKTVREKNILTIIAIISIALFVIFYIYGKKYELQVVPIGMLQKVIFAMIAGTTGPLTALIFLKYGRPDSQDALSSDTEGGINNLTDWERVKLSMFWIAAFIIPFSIALLA